MPGRAEPADGLGHRGPVAGHVEAPFGGHFLAPLGDERRLIGPHPAGDLDDLRVGGQLEIQLHRDRLAEHFEIAVLNVAAVFAEMDRDAVGPAQFGQHGGPDRVGLVGPPRLPQRRDMIDIHAK